MSKVKIYMPRAINNYEKLLKDLKVKLQVVSVSREETYVIRISDDQVQCLLALLSGIEQNKDKVELL